MFILKLSAACAIIAIFLGYFGGAHPAFDSIAIGRPLAAIWLLFTAMSLGKRLRFLGIAIAVLSLIPILIGFIPSQKIEKPALTIYQHNLLFTNSAPDLKLVTDQLTPDVITLQEIKSARANLDLIEGYKFRSICKFAAVGDVGILSKLSIIEKGCSDGQYRGFAWARVKNEEGAELTIVSIHTHWPYPFGQAAQIAELIPQLQELPRPIILAGDFNQVSWSHAINSLAASVNGIDKTGLKFTLIRPPLYLPIDHIIAPKEAVVHVEKLNRYGSDHNGLYAQFATWLK